LNLLFELVEKHQQYSLIVIYLSLEYRDNIRILVL